MGFYRYIVDKYVMCYKCRQFFERPDIPIVIVDYGECQELVKHVECPNCHANMLIHRDVLEGIPEESEKL